MTKESLLQQIKERIRDVYGDRLQGIILYGSEARDENKEDSDIDLLVLLRGPVTLVSDLQTIIMSLYDLQLEVLRPIHALPVDIEVYEAQKYALYRNVKKEGIRI